MKLRSPEPAGCGILMAIGPSNGSPITLLLAVLLFFYNIYKFIIAFLGRGMI